MDPQGLRDHLRAQCAALSAEERDRQGSACVAALKADPDVADAPAILSYAALDRECPVDALCEWCAASERPYLLPLVAGKAMRWFRVPDLTTLVSGAYGIREPDPDVHEEVVQMPVGAGLITPGVAFGPGGLRLGQGGGFYDRFLARWRSRLGPVIGVGFSLQWSEVIPVYEHDQPVDRVCLAGLWK